MKKNLFGLWALVGLISCTTFSKAKLDKVRLIQPGQSQEQVVEILGDPKGRIAKSHLNLWYYDLISDDNARIYPYTAKFENGILLSFDADYSRSMLDRELCRRRKNSGQNLIPLAGINGAPEVSVECAD